MAAGVLAVYLVVAAGTVLLSGRRVLPLFEGVGPPAPYQWVNPPPEFAAANVKPASGATNFQLNAQTQPQFASSPDSQCLLNLAPSPFPLHGSDTTVRAVLSPLDPATLAPLRFGSSTVADGNAYRIQLTYLPSGVALSHVVADGDVVITAPHRVNSLFYSADGRSWTKISFQPFGDPTMVGATFTAPGYFLAGANPKVIPGAAVSHRGHDIGILAVGLAVALLAVGLGAVAVIRMRRGRA